MKKYILAGLILITIKLYSEVDAPGLRGKVDISVQKGTLECNIIISNLPKVGSYFIHLDLPI